MNNQISFKKTLHNPLEALFGNDFNQKRYKKKSDVHFNNILSSLDVKEGIVKDDKTVLNRANTEYFNNKCNSLSSSEDDEKQEKHEKKEVICDIHSKSTYNNDNLGSKDDSHIEKTKRKSKTILINENSLYVKPKRKIVTERKSNQRLNNKKEKNTYRLIKQITSFVSKDKNEYMEEEYIKHKIVVKDRLIHSNYQSNMLINRSKRKKSSDSVKNIVTQEEEDYFFNENSKFLNGEQIYIVEDCSLSFYYKNEYIHNEKNIKYILTDCKVYFSTKSKFEKKENQIKTLKFQSELEFHIGMIESIDFNNHFFEIGLKDSRQYKIRFDKTENFLKIRSEIHKIRVGLNAFPNKFFKRVLLYKQTPSFFQKSEEDQFGLQNKYYKDFVGFYIYRRENQSTSQLNEFQVGSKDFFNFEKEFSRFEFAFSNTSFKLSQLNKEYSFCHLYPSSLVLSCDFNENSLKDLSKAFVSNRFPTMIWYSNVVKSSLWISSEVKSAELFVSSKDKISKYLLPLNNTNSLSIIRLLDLSLLNKENKDRLTDKLDQLVFGKELTSNFYLESYEVIKEKHDKMTGLISKKVLLSTSSKKLFHLLDDVGWVASISKCLKIVYEITSILKKKSNVLIMEGMNNDYSALISSLVQISLDSYYRTIPGFGLLIDKDWKSFSFEFSLKKEVFILFLDCLRQFILQFPSIFEYNLKFLLFLSEEVYSNKYNTFIYDSDYARSKDVINRNSFSLWQFVIDSNLKNTFYNPYYSPQAQVYYGNSGSINKTSVLFINFSLYKISFWNEYFYKNYTRLIDFDEKELNYINIFKNITLLYKKIDKAKAACNALSSLYDNVRLYDTLKSGNVK